MFSLRLRQFAWALSATVDLVGVTDVLHGRRVAYLARALARFLPPPLPWSEDDILLAGMLHDCGVSSTETHENLVRELEWDQADRHCLRGAGLLASAAPLAHLAGAVRLHHRPWSQTADPAHPTPDEWLGNLLFLADRLDVLAAAQGGDILYGSPEVVQRLSRASPRLFRPAFIAALTAASRTEAFWLFRDEAPLTRQFAPWIAADIPLSLSWEQIGTLFDLYGQCVDGKSPYTASHSRAVGRLSSMLGADLDLPEETCQMLRMAGLVHDIGKLRVPDRILDERGALGDRDFAVMKHHSFDSLDILTQIDGFEAVAQWASLHHERLDGSGYPYRKTGAQMPREARILAVADVFQALVQDRPYRRGLGAVEAADILGREAAAGRLDTEVVAVLAADLGRYYALGT